MTIKLELPDNNAVVLRNFGLALNNIAAELENVSQPETLGGGRPKDRTKVVQEAFDETFGGGRPKDRTKVGKEYQSVDEVSEDFPEITRVDQLDELQVEQTDALETYNESTKLDNGVEVDSKGLPHDTRIHADNRDKTAKGEWKNKRYPSSKFATKEDWQQYIVDVESELRAAMSVPAVETPVEQNIDINTAIEAFVNTEAPVVPAPPAVEAPVVPAPPVAEAVVPAPPVAEVPVVPAPPVVEAPVVPAPPVVEAPVVEAVKTFAELMTRITSAGHQAVPTIQAILTEMGIGSLPTLNTAAPEKIGEVYARFEQAIQGA